MPEIKNNFLKGRMNKDLDERLVPNGEYRDAMNIQISTSEGSDVGTVQNILGSIKHDYSPAGTEVIPPNCKCVGAISDEKNNKLYWFIKKEFNPLEDNFEAIIEFTPQGQDVPAQVTPVIIDTKVNTEDAVLKFPEKIITGINIIDNLIFWTDGVNEPRKINIDTCKAGSVIDPTTLKWKHTQLIFDKGGFNGCYVFDVALAGGGNTFGNQKMFSQYTANSPNSTQANGGFGRYAYFQREHLSSLVAPFDLPNHYNDIALRHYRDGKYLRTDSFKFFEDGNNIMIRYNPYTGTDVFDENHPRAIRVGDVFFADRNVYSDTSERDIREEHITVIKRKPTNKLNFKINTSIKTRGIGGHTGSLRLSREHNSNKKPLFENIFPRFSYRYKYADNEYSAFAPFTDVVFNPEHKKGYDLESFYNPEDSINTSMVNTIDSIELTDFISASTPEDVIQVDILYKREDSPIIYSIASVTHDDNEWHDIGSNLYSDIGYNSGTNKAHIVYGDNFKGRFVVDSENISNALPENQLLRPWDTVPRKALAQELTGNRIIYGNYVQGYTPTTKIPKVVADYNPRANYDLFYYKEQSSFGKGRNAITSNSFDKKGLPSIKSQRNYQLGVSFIDKYGRETPVFSSSKSAIKIPWRDKYGSISSTQSHQLNVELSEDPPSFAKYIKYFVKETTTEYYNLLMDDIYVPADYSTLQDKRFVWASFASSDRNKISEEDYIVLKKKIGDAGKNVVKNSRFKVLDIQDNAPDFVKYEYISYGKISQTGGFQVDGTGETDFLNNKLMTNSHLRPSSTPSGNRGTDMIMIHRGQWQGQRGMHFAFGDDDDISHLEKDLYFSFFRDNETLSGGRRRSKKYKISSVRTGTNYMIKLAEPISHDDMNLAKATFQSSSSTMHDDLVVEIEQRRLRKGEDFSGKFFVKIKADDLTTGESAAFGWMPGGIGGSLTEYSTTGSHDTFMLFDHHGSMADLSYYRGIHNSNTVYTGSSNSGRNYSYRKQHWGDLLDDIDANSNSNSRFFVDGMHMISGQISSNNYAKNSGQIWNGIHTSYPENPRWVGTKNNVDDQNQSVLKPKAPTFIGNTDFPFGTTNNGLQKVDDSIILNRGWEHAASMSARYPSGINNDRIVNGLEGYINGVHKMHQGPMGARRWKKENKTGQGLYKADFSFDDTYGNTDEQGKSSSNTARNFLYLSYLAPGKDLCPHDVYGNTISPTSTNFIGRWLQGIWGGGCFTTYDGSPFGVNLDLYSFPMEGKSRVTNLDKGQEPPGPGVPYSIGYDEAYREYHENQWNPCWPEKEKDPDGKTQEFINNLKVGHQFRFQGKGRIYTILGVSVKKLYNHTNWKATRYPSGTNNYRQWGNEWTPLANDGNDSPGSGYDGSLTSVEEAALNYGQYLITEGSDDGSDAAGYALTALKDIIKLFGRANNRRICYILELDTCPHNSDDVFNDGNMDNDTARNIEFIKPVTGGLKIQNKKPIVWETEPKENTDLEIYHEASDAIPTIIDETTKDFFAPAGSIVEFLEHDNSVLLLQNDIDGQVFESPNILKRWHSENEIELYPGFIYEDESDTEIDYSGTKLRFYKKDGSYNTVLLAAQESDPGNTKGYSLKGREYRTRFLINRNIKKDLKVGLSWHNCFSFGNGIESNRVKDGFNEMVITNGPIVSTTIDTDYQEENRTSGLIYSGIYNADVSVNNLNQFIQAEKITKDLNPTYGSIQKLFQRRVGLVAFCEDRIINIIAGKDTLFNADGTPQLISSTNVLGDATPFVGDFGISKNPESFSSESYRAYFSDKQRGAILRLSMDGLTPISDVGMRDWFRDNIGSWDGSILGTYDEYKKEYNVSLLNANLFSTNILRNPNINEGIATGDLSLPPTNYIYNGQINSGVGLILPGAANGGGYSDTYNTIINGGIDSRALKSEVEITNYATIPQGHFYPGYTGGSMNSVFSGASGWNTVLASFTVHTKPDSAADNHGVELFNFDFVSGGGYINYLGAGSINFLTDMKAQTSYAIGWGVQNFQGWQSNSGSICYQGANSAFATVNSSNKGIQKTLYKGTSLSQLEADANYFPMTSPNYPEHQMGVYAIGFNGGFSSYSGSGTMPPAGMLVTGPHVHMDLGPMYNMHDIYGGLVFPGIYNGGTTTPWTQTNTSGGNRPNNLVSTSVTGWPSNTHNISVGSSGGENYHNNTTSLPSTSQTFTPYGNGSGSGGDFSTANNTTIFAGEEIRITFKIVRLVQRKHGNTGAHPLTSYFPSAFPSTQFDWGNNHTFTPSSPDLKIQLLFMDGSINSIISDDIICNSTNADQTDITQYPYNTFQFQSGGTGTQGSDPTNTTGLDEDKKVGYITNLSQGKYTFPSSRGQMKYAAATFVPGPGGAGGNAPYQGINYVTQPFNIDTNNVFATDTYSNGETWALVEFEYECYVKFKPTSVIGYTGSTSPYNGSTGSGILSFNNGSDYHDQIVINDLNIRLGVDNALTNNSPFFLQNFKVEKTVELQSPVDKGQLSFPAEVPIPAQEIPGFTTIARKMWNDKWTTWCSPSASYDAIIMAHNAKDTFGPNTHNIGNNMEYGHPNGGVIGQLAEQEQTLVNSGINLPGPSQETFKWHRLQSLSPTGNLGSYIGGNGITYPNSTHNPLNPVTQSTASGTGNLHDHQVLSPDEFWGNDIIKINNPNDSATLNQTLPSGTFVVDNWYLVDVMVKNYVQGEVAIAKAIDPDGYGAPGGKVYFDDPSNSYNNIDMRDPGQPVFGHFGDIDYKGSSYSNGDSRNIIALEIQPGSVFHNEPASGRDLTGALKQPLSGTTLVNNQSVTGMKVFRAVFKVHSNSWYNFNTSDQLQIWFDDFVGDVDWVNIANITGAISGGTAPGWDTTRYSSHDAYQPSIMYNQFSRRTSYWDGGKFNFRNAYASDAFEQDFSANPNPFDFIASPSPDGYTFRFTVSNYQQGKLRVQLRTANHDGSGNTLNYNGLHCTAMSNGDFEISNIVLSDDGTNYGITYSESGDDLESVTPYDSLSGWTLYSSAIDSNRLIINGVGTYADYIAGSSNSHFTGDVSNISLVDATSIVSGGVIGAWDITGFDPAVDTFITYDAGTINLDGASPAHSIQQNIVDDLLVGQAFRINIYYDLTFGSFRIYYFNKDGNGFRTNIMSAADGVSYYDDVHVIGDDAISVDDIRNTFVIEFMEANVVGSLDNISMKREYIVLEENTLSFSEETKGWISFKSFIPENGVSLAKQYYTFKDGYLHQHHANETRNQFYDQDATTITESLVSFVFNQEASLVKIFNTLNYEGSQSQIHQYDTNYIDETIRPDNITAKDGWYVNSITTDKQTGSIKEFIEKEGKWFNYIRGNNNASIETSEFSLQGIGIVSGNVTTISSSNGGNGGGATNGGGGATGGTY